ncbi:tRNA lysidine(34) synthetase TilS [Falsiroseomonas sp. HW251]|uniref:tRNA lysidine(34) synthetase TilS n=1 Tax=Falsiroseomonas sp. HW251 TaxID=3390998 RepID=UPI003D318FFB
MAVPLTQDDFAALMAPLGPFGPQPLLVAGVSGGPHSLALALLADGWARAQGGSLLVVICDHGLRAESTAEAAGVAALLAGQGIAARVVPLRLCPGAGMQARAREARLAALLEVCADRGAPWLLLGHHRADQAETVLLRGLAGSGPAGLAAMAPARAQGPALVLRPLLGVAPARLEAVLAARGIVPVRDPSNRDPRFERARLRAALADPDGDGASTAALAEAASRLGARRAGFARDIAVRLAKASLLHEAGFARLDLPALGSDGVAAAALALLIRVIGGGAHLPAAAAVARLLAAGQGTLGGAVLRRSGLLLREEAALAPPVPAEGGALWDGRFRLEAAGPGLDLGPAGPAARRLPRPAWMPAGVAPTLPALLRNGELAVVPALAYPDATIAVCHALRFAPLAGPGA